MSNIYIFFKILNFESVLWAAFYLTQNIIFDSFLLKDLFALSKEFTIKIF